MLHGASKLFAGFNNSRPRGDRFPRNKGAMMKRDVNFLMDDDRPRRKKRRFDQGDEKDPVIRNQNVSQNFNGYNRLNCIILNYHFFYFIGYV